MMGVPPGARGLASLLIHILAWYSSVHVSWKRVPACTLVWYGAVHDDILGCAGQGG